MTIPDILTRLEQLARIVPKGKRTHSDVQREERPLITFVARPGKLLAIIQPPPGDTPDTTNN